MTSKKQISANRANAKRSTGPKTATGKRRSSLNALKHGLTAQTIVVGDEDPAQFEALRDGYADDYSPATNTEQELVERLAAYSWRLRRIPLFEAAYMQCFEKQMRDKDDEDRMFDPLASLNDDEDDEVSDSYTTQSMAIWLSRSEEFHNALAKLSRYEAFLLNAFNRTLQQLLFLRSQRQLPPSDLIEGSVSDDSESGAAAALPAN